MIKEMKGWKVITKYRESACASHWEANRNNWAVLYPLNEIAVPKVKGTKLMFFKDKKDADNFCNSRSENIYKVVPCIGYGVVRIKYISWLVTDVLKFWNNKRMKKRLNTNNCELNVAPKGTYGADAIKCLE